MFQSRLSGIVEPRIGTETDSRFSSQFKISRREIEILARVVDLFLFAIASILGRNRLSIRLVRKPRHGRSLFGRQHYQRRGIRLLGQCARPVPASGAARSASVFWPAARDLCCYRSFGGWIFLLYEGSAAFPASPLVAALLPQMILLVIVRWVFAEATRALLFAGRLDGRRVVTIGEPAELLGLNASFLLRYCGLREVFRVAVATKGGRRQSEVRASLDGALAAAHEHGAEEFLVALHWDSQELLATIRSRLCDSPLPVRLLPDHNMRTLLGRRGLSADGLSLPVTRQRAPLSAFERAVKRTLDVCGSMTAIVMLWPLFLLVAIAIKLDSVGPIIFRQRRTGFNAKEFVIFKFRTMSVLEDGPGIAQACRDDPRATLVGKFLRRSSIDELPQLLNV